MRKFFLKNIWLINFYPPFIGAGIKMTKYWNSEDSIGFLVKLKLRFWNKNFAGSQFGGSLYSMCDPWFVFIAAIYLDSEDFVIWDRSADITYVRPGRSNVVGKFEISRTELEEMKRKIESGEKIFRFEAILKDANDEEIAVINKEIYIRPKSKN